MTSAEPTFRFPKEERLMSKKLIEELFERGSSFSLHPFRVLYLPNPERAASYHQVLISVPRRNFKKAVQRNLIKRRIRESYRLTKSALRMNSKATIPYLLAYVYISKKVLSSDEISDKLKSSLDRLIQVWNA